MSLRSKSAVATVPAGGRLDIVLLAGKLHRATLGVSVLLKKQKKKGQRGRIRFLDKVSELVGSAKPQMEAAAGNTDKYAKVIASLVSGVLYAKYVMLNTDVDRNRDPNLWKLVNDDYENPIFWRTAQYNEAAKLLVPRFLELVRESISRKDISRKDINVYEPDEWDSNPEKLAEFADVLEMIYKNPEAQRDALLLPVLQAPSVLHKPHVHNFLPEEEYDAETEMWTKRCACGFSITYERI